MTCLKTAIPQCLGTQLDFWDAARVNLKIPWCPDSRNSKKVWLLHANIQKFWWISFKFKRTCVSVRLHYLRLHVHSCVATPHSVLRFLPVGSWRRSLHAVQHSLLYHEQQATGCHDHGERQHRRHDGGVSSHGGRAHGRSEVDQGSARSFNPVLLLARRHSESHALKSPSVCRGSVTTK